MAARWLSAFAVVVGVAMGAALFLSRGDREASTEIPLEADFGEKIVYGTDGAMDAAPLRVHCDSLGGSFNECGSPCPPGSATCIQVCAFTCEDIPQGSGRGSEGAEEPARGWETFESSDFGFAIPYPAQDWSLEADTSFHLSPKFNVYLKPPGVPLDLPMDHFANVDHFSVYPKGIPTEGVFGRTVPFSGDAGFEFTPESKLYLLEDGTPFAAMILPAHPPQSWNSSGFIWMRLRIHDLRTRCQRNGEVVSPEDCDPMMRDDRIIRSGSVDEEVWRREQAMLRRFAFLAPDSAPPRIRVREPSPGETVSGPAGIRVSAPSPGETVSSPLQIRGEARGPWYFEGSFPVVLTDWDGRIIAEGNAEAQGEWTVEDFVPFRAGLDFQSPFQDGDPEFMRSGALILRKANPSGLPENAAAREIPVTFQGRGPLP